MSTDFPQRARRDQHEKEDDHRGRRGPGDFDRLAAVDLCRFRGAVAGRLPESPHGVEQHAFDDDEDQHDDGAARIPRLTIDWALGEAGLQIETFREGSPAAASIVHVPIASTWNNPSGLVFATAATTDSISLVCGVASRRKAGNPV